MGGKVLMSTGVARIKVLIVSAAAGCAILAGGLGAYELEINCDLTGSISYQGKPAAVGTTLRAYAGSVLLADTTVRVTGYYAISIPPDNPSTPSLDGWVDGVDVTIHIDGRSAQPAIMPAGGPLHQDLSVPMISDVRKSTWGKIKALFR